MTIIKATDLVVEFPIYGISGNRSLKKSLMNMATGGVLAKDAGNRMLVKALDGLNFEFHEGDRIGLSGHNGSGKTTLLQVLAGIYEPTGGSIEIQGQVTSMLGITLGMDSEVTGLENIFLRCRIMGLSRREIEERVDRIADFSGIGDYLHLPMRTYSSGMAMRLAFAIATSMDADIVLMDEWLSVGDASFVDKARHRLTDMVKNARLVVIASHDPGILREQCDIILHLEHGKIASVQKV